MSTSAVEIGLRTSGVLRSEWLKLWTVRSLPGLLIGMVAAAVGAAALMAATVEPEDFTGTDTSITSIMVEVITVTMVLATIVVALYGALAVTQEHDSGMAATSLMAVPTRTRLLAARTAAVAAACAGATAVALGLGIGLAAVVLPADRRGELAEPAYWRTVAGALLYAVLIAVLAVAIGALVPAGAGGVACSVGLVFVAPIFMNIVGAVLDATWVRNLAALLPTNAGSQLFHYSLYRSGVPTPDPGLIALGPLGGGLVLLGWVVVALAAATAVLGRRDV